MGTYINPNPPAIAVKQSELNLHYYDDIYCVEDISDYLVNDIGSAIGHIFTNPSEYIYYLRCYPFDITLLDTAPSRPKADVYFGHEQSNFKMHWLTADYKTSLNLATYKIEPVYNSYLDYAPYTKITMYLPYIGFVELDTNEVMGKTLSVDYLIDLDSAEALVTISIIDDVKSYVIRTERGKIGFDIPIGSSNMRDQIRNMVTSTIGLLGGTVSTIPKTASNMFNALQSRYSKGTIANQGINNLTMPQSIYIIREMNSIITDPKDYKGKPVEMTGTLSDYHGFTSIDSYGSDIDLSFATKDEADELKSLLQSGVYLP